MSLAEARKILKKFGSDSVEDKTVADLLQDWFDQNQTTWRRPEQMEGYICRLTADDPRLVAMNIHVVDLVTVRNSLKNYACKHGNVAANRLVEILKQVFKHAVQVGYLQYSPIAELTRKVVGGVEKSGHRILIDREIQLLWNIDRHTELFRFLLLTGQRIRETQIARWGDINGDRWFIPASNNKSARDHWVSLSPQSQELLNSLGARRGRVFSSGSSTAVQSFLRRWCERHRIGENNSKHIHKGFFTPHDLRRTFATRLNELRIGPHIVGLLLEDAARALVQPGGAGEFIGEPAPLPAGIEYRVTANYVNETVEPDSQVDWSYRVLAAGPDGYQVKKLRGDRVDDCSDRLFFRAITHDAPQSCRSQSGATTKTTLLMEDGQVSYLPATLNTATVYEAEIEQLVTLSSGREFTTNSRQIRACYAEWVETITVPAGSFDTVRFRCGSVVSDSNVHDKQYGLVWVDRNTGLPVRSEMEVHTVYRSNRYRLNEQVVSLGTP